MPIYAYRCESCGHAKDVLQKVSDPLLTTCPACGAESFKKQLTAAGFQLKGSGWYVTDFRNGNSGAKTEAAGAPAVGSKSDEAATTPAAKTDTAASAAPSTASTTSTGDSGPASGSGSPSASA